MQGHKITIPVLLLLLFTATFAFSQSEVLKPVINNLALYKQNKDLKFLAAAKKSMDSLVTTHSDSADFKKSVYRAIVNSTIVYTDSLNTLKQPATLFTQTVDLVEVILASKKSTSFPDQLDYVKRCLANVYIRMGFQYMNTSDYVNAQRAFINAQHFEPSFKQLNFYIAYSYYKLGNLQDASKYYTDLISSTDNTKPEFIETTANIYKSMGDTAKALEIIKKGRKTLPNDRLLLLDEANIYNNNKDYAALAPLLSQLVDMYPNNADVLFVAANCYDNLNDPKKAETYYLNSIELNSSAYSPVFNLGLLYFKESLAGGEADKNTRLAIQMLEKANEIAPNNVKCLQVLQLIYAQTQNSSQLNKVNNKLKQLTN